MSDAQQPQPYAYAQPGPRPRIPESTPVYTPFIWIMAVLPVLAMFNAAIYRPEYRYRTIGGLRTVDPASAFPPSYFVVLVIGILAYGIAVVLAWLDRRELLRRGVERPFHWAFAFLTYPVYLIGRGVIVHRVASPRGLAPIWLWSGLTVVAIATTLVITLTSMAGMLQNIRS